MLSRYVADALRAGDGVVVVATPEHRSLLAQALSQQGVDPSSARRTGRFCEADAAETLGAFRSGDGVIDAALFESTVGGVLDAAGAGGRPVRVFGEMVALLWDEGDVAGALELEGLWNDLAGAREFTLLCGYPTSALRDPAELAPGTQVCRLHSEVLPPDSYLSDVAPLGQPDGLRRRTEVFLPRPEAVSTARRFVRCTLQSWGEEDAVQDALLIVSELASNALLHARSAFRVSVAQLGDVLRIGVEDVEPLPPEEFPPSDAAEQGRGVSIVGRLSTEWGTGASKDGKVVWAELPAAAG